MQVHNWFVNARRRYVQQIAAKRAQDEAAKALVEGKPLAMPPASTLPYTKRRGGFAAGSRSRAAKSKGDPDEHADDEDDAVPAVQRARKATRRAAADESESDEGSWCEDDEEDEDGDSVDLPDDDDTA